MNDKKQNVPEVVWYKRYRLAIVGISILCAFAVWAMIFDRTNILNTVIIGIQAIIIAYIGGDSFRKSIYDYDYGYHQRPLIDESTNMNIQVMKKKPDDEIPYELDSSIPPSPYIENEKE